MATRNLAKEYAETLNAQFQAQQNFFPLQLQQQQLQQQSQLANYDMLLGGYDASEYDTTSYTPALYKQGNKYTYGALPKGFAGPINYPNKPDSGGGGGGGGGGFPGSDPLGFLSGGGDGGLIPGIGDLFGGGGGGGFLGGLFGGGDDGPPRRLISPSGYSTEHHTMPGQRGLLAILGQEVIPWRREQRRSANPENVALLDAMNTQALQDLGLGTRIDPEDAYRITSRVRNDWSNRGLGNAAPGQLDEALQLFGGGQALQNTRRDYANNVFGNNQQFYNGVDDTSAILAQAGGILGGARGVVDTNAESPYAGDLYNTNFNAAIAKSISDANNRAALIGAGISAAGSVGGGLAALCWAAREVFGADNPQWLQFREWLLNEAPAKLRNWYAANGEKWAARLKNNPLAKAVVKRWMERRIERN